MTIQNVSLNQHIDAISPINPKPIINKKMLIIATITSAVGIGIISYFAISYFGIVPSIIQSYYPQLLELFYNFIGYRGDVVKVDGLNIDTIKEGFYFKREGIRLLLSTFIKVPLAIYQIRSVLKSDNKTTYDKCINVAKIVFSIGLIILAIDSIYTSIWRIKSFYRLALTGINSQGANINNLPVALVLRPVYDPNGSFDLNDNLDLFSNIESNCFLRTKKVANLIDIKNAIEKVSNAFGKVKLLIFSAHGSVDAIKFSNTLNGIVTTYSTLPGRFFDGVAKDAKVVLDSCTTGGFSYEGKNMVDFFARKLPGRWVFGPTRSTYGIFLKFKSIFPLSISFENIGSALIENILHLFGLERFSFIFSQNKTYKKSF